MTEFLTNIVTNTLRPILTGAVATAGGVAGDAIAGFGDFIENSGQAVGNGISNRFDSWGQGVASYGKPSKGGSVSQRAAVKSPIAKQPARNTSTKAIKASVSSPKVISSSKQKALSSSTAGYPSKKVPVKRSMITGPTAALKNTVPNVKAPMTTKTSVVKSFAATSEKSLPQKQSLPSAGRPVSSTKTAEKKYPGRAPQSIKSSPAVTSSVKHYVPNAGFVGGSTASSVQKDPLNLTSL